MSGLTPKQRKLSLAAAIASSGGMGLASAMTYPLIAVYLEGRGYSSLAIGTVAAAFSIGIFAGGPVLPLLLRRVGTVVTVVLGALVGAACVALFPFGRYLGFYFALRLAMGMGNAWHWMVGESWINTVASDAHRGKVIALYATLWGASTAVGPALLAAVGSEGIAPFFLAGAALAATVPPVVMARSLAPSLGRGVEVAGVYRLVRLLPIAALVGVVCGFSESLGLTLLPVYGSELGLDADRAVLLTASFALGNFLLQVPIGWLADRMRPIALVAACALVLTAGVLAIPAAFSAGAVLWPLLVVVGGTAGGFYTLGLVLVGRRFEGGQLATASAGFILSYTAGMSVGPPVAGSAMDALGPSGLIGVWGIAMAAFTVGVLAYLFRPAARAGGSTQA